MAVFMDLFQSASDIDEIPLGESDVERDELVPCESIQGTLALGKSDSDDRTLIYGVVASLVLHVVTMALLVRSGSFVPTQALLRPGEKVTSVRLVEPPPVEKKIEQPPEKAAAISDRDHSARFERIPKQLPGSKPPLGRVEPQQRVAALTPPVAPEDLVKPEKEKQKNGDPDKPDAKERLLKKDPSKNKAVASLDRKKSIRNLDVDLAPTPQEVAQGLSRPGAGQDFFPDGDPDEIVVDINTREDKFFSYLLHLKQKIQGVWIYPNDAARAGIGGSLTVEFAVGSDGRLLYANLLDSSGHNLLDQSALRAIQTAAPYYPFPPRMKTKRLRIRANFIYVTGNYFRRIM